MNIIPEKNTEYTIFVDIETIPGKTTPDLEEIQAPSNYKDPKKIVAYKQAKLEETHRKQAFDSMKGEIVCIGFCVEGPGQTEILAPKALTRGLEGISDEEDLLDAFEEYVEPFENVCWVGHNVKDFDLQWIWRKAVKYDQVVLRRKIPRDRYSKNIKDTMLLWAGPDYRDKTGLDAIAKFLGIEGKTPGMDGSKVYDLWLEDRLEEIRDYCRQDVWLTQIIYKVITGKL